MISTADNNISIKIGIDNSYKLNKKWKNDLVNFYSSFSSLVKNVMVDIAETDTNSHYANAYIIYVKEVYCIL